MQYTVFQWLLFFYSYAFLGWIWECCYVAANTKKWTNRGFLAGPLIPIYGFGAIIVLWLTLPFRENLLAVYILGLLGASILEYFVGVIMEKLFNVRYWDYSQHKYNLNGHISLFVSLGWGIFSIILIKFLHKPIEGFILQIPANITELSSLILSFFFVSDTTRSVQAALDLKELLKEGFEESSVIKTLTARLDDVKININKLTKELEERKELSREERIKNLRAKVHARYKARVENIKSYDPQKEINEIKEEIKILELRISKRLNKRISDLIQRNPNSVSKEFEERLKEIKAAIEKKRKTK